jgi:hypothetical protein
MPARLRLFPVFLVMLPLVGCAHWVSRQGYRPLGGARPDCEDLTLDDMVLDPALGSTKIGTVKLRDTGISLWCSKERAFRIFQREACAAGANVVNLIAQESPNIWSSCYRATAELWRAPASELEALKARQSATPKLQNLRNKN